MLMMAMVMLMSMAMNFTPRFDTFEILFFPLMLLVIDKVVNKHKEMGEVAKDLIKRMICNSLRSAPEKRIKNYSMYAQEGAISL